MCMEKREKEKQGGGQTDKDEGGEVGSLLFEKNPTKNRLATFVTKM